MTALFSTRRRAEDFAAALDGAAGTGGPRKDLDDELRELVEVVGVLRSPDLHTGAATPRADFAADLRSRLLAEAEHMLTPETARLRLPARQPARRERRLVAAATAAVLLGGSAGMATAAQQALPGDALYPIKRGIEQAEAGLSLSAGGKGRDLLHHASDRLDEVRALLAASPPTATPQVPSTLADFTAQAREGADLLMADYRETRDPASIVEVREFTAHGMDVLRDVAPSAPVDAQDELADAALTLEEIDAAAIMLCGSCAQHIPALDLPQFLLAAAEVDRTLERLESGRLDNSHPVEVDKQLVDKVGQLAAGGEGAEGDTAQDSSPRGSDGAQKDSPGLPLPGGTDGGSKGGDQGGLLGQLGGTVGDLGDGLTGGDSGTGGDDQESDAGSGGGGLLEDTTDPLTDTLDDTVETLLPDPETDGGLDLLP